MLGPSPTGAPCSRGWAHQCYSLEGLPGRTDESLNFVLKAGRSHRKGSKEEERLAWPVTFWNLVLAIVEKGLEVD